MIAKRYETLAERPPDHLVHCVVAANVLADASRLAPLVEEPGRVEPARALEPGLAEAVGKDRQDVALDLGPDRERRREHLDLLDRALAADAA